MNIKQGIRRNFARRAGSYDRYAGVQRLMGERLLGMISPWVGGVESLLEVGCGTGFLTERLRQANAQARMVALDLDPSLVSRARRRLGPDARLHWVVADAESWVRGAFDLIISNAVFHWLTLPGLACRNFLDCLNPGGRLAFAALGPQTFQELDASLKRAGDRLDLTLPEIPARSFLEREDWAALLARAGFAQVNLLAEEVRVEYPGVMDFLKALQATGATNPRPRAFSPRLLRCLIGEYDAIFRHNGAVPVTYEIIWAVAEK